MITASTVKGIFTPIAVNKEPKIPLRPNAISRAMPATEGGSTVGRSSSVSKEMGVCQIAPSVTNEAYWRKQNEKS